MAATPTGHRIDVKDSTHAAAQEPVTRPDVGVGTRLRRSFTRTAGRTANAVGSPWAFLTALSIVAVWGLTGPLFGFSDTWQLVINTGTTIVTFLMVFLIQNTQNRDAKALHLKLDELIRAVDHARNEIIDVEEDTDEELGLLQDEYRTLHHAATDKDAPAA